MNSINKKKILIFSLVYYPNFIGGAEVAVKEITDRLARQKFSDENLGGLSDEYDFDMVTLRLARNLPKVEKIGNVTIYRVGFAGSQSASSDSLPWYLNLNKYLMPITAFWTTSNLIRKNQYDIIWSIMASYNSFTALIAKIFYPKIKFLLTLQEGDPIEYIKKRAQPVWPFFKMIFAKADHIQAISNYLADFGREMGAKCPITVVPNGVDVKAFSHIFSMKEIEEWKEKIEKKPGDLFIVTASRLVKKNAVSDIVKSLVHLDNHVKLAIAGTGYEEKALRELARTLGIYDRVVFLGRVSHIELPKLLKACDVFVRPSLSEGFGNSFVEAMAAKIPVVATPVGGIVDFLRDPSNTSGQAPTGLFCEVSNPESIAEKVKILLENKNVREPIVQNAFDMVTEKYDWDIVAKEMGEIFDKLSNSQ